MNKLLKVKLFFFCQVENAVARPNLRKYSIKYMFLMAALQSLQCIFNITSKHTQARLLIFIVIKGSRKEKKNL